MFEIAEQKLEAVLGVSRDTLTDQRENLKKDADWCIASCHVMYSLEGLRKLLASLSIAPVAKKDAKPGDLTLESIIALSAIGGDEENARMFEVIDLSVKNSRIVMAKLLGEKKERGTHFDGVARIGCK
ncbi:unnamed protein product, partial [marine sediment metagenome]